MAFVAALGLIVDKPSFDKKEVRARTGLLFVLFLFIPSRPSYQFSSVAVTNKTSSTSYANSPRVSPNSSLR